MSLQGHRARVPSETSLGVVGLVSGLFREVSERLHIPQRASEALGEAFELGGLVVSPVSI